MSESSVVTKEIPANGSVQQRPEWKGLMPRKAREEYSKELVDISRLIVARVLAVYREDYIERCVREEPNSLLALVKRMEGLLAHA